MINTGTNKQQNYFGIYYLFDSSQLIALFKVQHLPVSDDHMYANTREIHDHVTCTVNSTLLLSEHYYTVYHDIEKRMRRISRTIVGSSGWVQWGNEQYRQLIFICVCLHHYHTHQCLGDNTQWCSKIAPMEAKQPSFCWLSVSFIFSY